MIISHLTLAQTLFVRLMGLALLVVIGTTSIYGQTSSLSGVILDPQGNVLAGVKVKLINTDKNFNRETTTSSEGKYQFPQMPPGTYSVRAEAQGFASLIEENVQLLVNSPITLNLSFTKLGDLSETITVQSDAALLNTSDATIGNNFTAPQISTLPLNARNVVGLLSLQPGVTQSGYVTGSRSDQANIVLDGVDVNEQQTGLDPLSDRDLAFSSVLRTTPDSIQEFRVTTTNPNANQGRSSGGQVELVTKGGTNQFHGSLYEFHRNTITTANDFFNNHTKDALSGKTLERPALIRNIFGGTIGGPIKQDRVFFFYTYEGRRDASQQTVIRPVPLASMGRGELSFRENILDASGNITGNRIRTLSTAELNTIFPRVGMNPAAITALGEAAKRYPANDLFSIGDGLNYGGYRFNASTPLSWNTHIAKFDFSLNDKHNLFIRANYQMDNIGAAQRFPDTPTKNTWHHPLGYSIGHSWTISNNMVNRLNYGLTRLAFSDRAESTLNNISFRYIFEPNNFTRTFHRTTPTHNITDDLSWIKGNHTFQFGTNLRFVRNNRKSATTSYDRALTNPDLYSGSGSVLSNPIRARYNLPESGVTDVRRVMAALIGRFSQYEANINYGSDGSILPVGTEINRTFATEQYDWYAQDSWKIGKSLTINAGLRYGLNSPVYEANGLQVKPTTNLAEYFEKRKAAAAIGKSYNEPISVDLAGPKNNRSGYYPWDTNNFQPRISVAWSPDFNDGLLKKMFGESNKSVFRGGFAMVHDQIGQQLAVFFDRQSQLGYSSSQSIAANTFNVTSRPAPRFTNFGQNVRSFPFISVDDKLQFPLTVPADGDQRIESSLDENIVSPVNYSWNVSYSRELPRGLTVEASYIGRRARNLLAQRDVLAFNNLVDPKSGMDWYTAGTQLAKLSGQNADIATVAPIPYFENLFPGIGGDELSSTQMVYYLLREETGPDYTYLQAVLNNAGIVENAFVHPQYAAFSTFSTIGRSDYHAGTITAKQRLKNQLYLDFNYTFSKSIDTGSGLQNSGAFGTAFILNSLRPDDNRAVSDFDVRHIINVNSVWDMPFGRGKKYFAGIPKVLDAFVGGWQLSSIFRWNSGLPVTGCCSETGVWATNWQITSKGVRINPIESSPNKKNLNLFSDPKAAYQSFRNAYPGETGDRNFLRLPSYVVLDLGLAKTFKMPWNETQSIQFRADTFNLTNTQKLGNIGSLSLGTDPNLGSPRSNFGVFNSIQGSPRVMQFSLRYSF